MNNGTTYIDQLKTFINFASISADEKQKKNIYACAEWLVHHLLSIGLQNAKMYYTSSHPVVYAEYLTHPSNQTILFYGHYDVQPIDPINKWHNPPFQPVIKDDFIYGRGSSDDKGQLFIHVKAVEQLLKSGNSLPINIKFIIEGAEEVGSTGLKDFITDHKELLRSNVVVVSDTKMASINTPAITYSLRGALNVEVSIQTSKKDLHSGTFGGCVPNAAAVLSEFIYKLHSKDGSIAIPHFYDDVEQVSEQERKFMQLSGIPDVKILSDAESKKDWGERNYTLYERTTIRPSLSVTGIAAGYQGEGVKNVIPSAASVKLNFRLVNNQRPQKVKFLLDNYLKSILPDDAFVKTVYSSFANPVVFSRSNPYLTAATKSIEDTFHNKVKLIRAGGTIPAVDYLSTILKIPVVLMGFAQASDNMHAPNERFYLPNFFRGIKTIQKFIVNTSQIGESRELFTYNY